MLQMGRLSRRFTLYVSTGAFLFALIVGIFLFIFEFRAEHERANLVVESMEAAVHISATVSVFAKNEPIAEDVVKNLVINPFVVEAWLLADPFHGGGETEVFRKSSSLRPIDEKEDQLLTWRLYSPIDEATPIGTLGIRKDGREINKMARKSAFRYATFLALQVLSVALLILLAFQKMIGKPLARIEKDIGQAKPWRGTKILVPEGHQNTEIGALVESTNQLLQATENAIAKERRLKSEVDEMEARFRNIFTTTSIGIMILDKNGGLLSCNPVLSRITGLSEDALEEARHKDFLARLFAHPEHARSMIDESFLSGQTVTADLEVILSGKSNAWMNCMLSVTQTDSGQVALIEGVLYDVTERRAKESEAKKAAEMDALTGLANRRGMEVFLNRALRLAHAQGTRVGILLLDLDGFKAVNDQHGHAAGDIVLCEIAARMSTRMRRSSDLVARLGGDEFVLIVADFDAVTPLLSQLASDFVRLIREPVEIAPQTFVTVGASIGIAYSPLHARTAEDLIRAADDAMYEVKAQGKNAYAFAKGHDAS